MALLTSLVYLTAGDEVLMLYRNKKKHDVNHGKWIGVGGKFEPGETPTECARREVEEETGFAPTALTPRGVILFQYPDIPERYMFLYTGTLPTKDIVQNDEGTLRWVKRDDLFDLELWAGDRLFLRPLLFTTDWIEWTLRYDAKGTLIEAQDVWQTKE